MNVDDSIMEEMTRQRNYTANDLNIKEYFDSKKTEGYICRMIACPIFQPHNDVENNCSSI